MGFALLFAVFFAATGEDPVLSGLVSAALEHNPEIAAAEAGVTAARQRVAQSSALPDPMASVGYTNDGWSPSLGGQPMTNLAFMTSQDLPFPGKRRLRGELAEREADQAAQQLARVRLRVAADVRRAYYGLVLARQLGALTDEQRQTWRAIEGVVRARYAVGQGAQQDVLRIQVEQTRVEQSAFELSAEAEIRLAELNRLLARPSDSPIETPAKLILQHFNHSIAEVLAEASAMSPELANGRLAVQRGHLGSELAKKEYKPDFEVKAGYMNRGGLDPMWQAGVGITLPINRKRRASVVAEAAALTRGSERVVESLDLQLRFRTQERYSRLQSTERIITLYEQGILRQDQMSVEAATASYQTGKASFVTVLEAQTALFADRWTHARLLADHARLLVALVEASLEQGAEMTTTDGSGAAAMGRR